MSARSGFGFRPGRSSSKKVDELPATKPPIPRSKSISSVADPKSRVPRPGSQSIKGKIRQVWSQPATPARARSPAFEDEMHPRIDEVPSKEHQALTQAEEKPLPSSLKHMGAQETIGPRQRNLLRRKFPATNIFGTRGSSSSVSATNATNKKIDQPCKRYPLRNIAPNVAASSSVPHSKREVQIKAPNVPFILEKTSQTCVKAEHTRGFRLDLKYQEQNLGHLASRQNVQYGSRQDASKSGSLVKPFMQRSGYYHSEHTVQDLDSASSSSSSNLTRHGLSPCSTGTAGTSVSSQSSYGLSKSSTTTSSKNSAEHIDSNFSGLSRNQSELCKTSLSGSCRLSVLPETDNSPSIAASGNQSHQPSNHEPFESKHVSSASMISTVSASGEGSSGRPKRNSSGKGIVRRLLSDRHRLSTEMHPSICHRSTTSRSTVSSSASFDIGSSRTKPAPRRPSRDGVPHFEIHESARQITMCRPGRAEARDLPPAKHGFVISPSKTRPSCSDQGTPKAGTAASRPGFGNGNRPRQLRRCDSANSFSKSSDCNHSTIATDLQDHRINRQRTHFLGAGPGHDLKGRKLYSAPERDNTTMLGCTTGQLWNSASPNSSRDPKVWLGVSQVASMRSDYQDKLKNDQDRGTMSPSKRCATPLANEHKQSRGVPKMATLSKKQPGQRHPIQKSSLLPQPTAKVLPSSGLDVFFSDRLLPRPIVGKGTKGKLNISAPVPRHESQSSIGPAKFRHAENQHDCTAELPKHQSAFRPALAKDFSNDRATDRFRDANARRSADLGKPLSHNVVCDAPFAQSGASIPDAESSRILDEQQSLNCGADLSRIASPVERHESLWFKGQFAGHNIGHDDSDMARSIPPHSDGNPDLQHNNYGMPYIAEIEDPFSFSENADLSKTQDLPLAHFPSLPQNHVRLDLTMDGRNQNPDQMTDVNGPCRELYIPKRFYMDAKIEEEEEEGGQGEEELNAVSFQQAGDEFKAPPSIDVRKKQTDVRHDICSSIAEIGPLSNSASWTSRELQGEQDCDESHPLYGLHKDSRPVASGRQSFTERYALIPQEVNPRESLYASGDLRENHQSRGFTAEEHGISDQSHEDLDSSISSRNTNTNSVDSQSSTGSLSGFLDSEYGKHQFSDAYEFLSYVPRHGSEMSMTSASSYVSANSHSRNRQPSRSEGNSQDHCYDLFGAQPSTKQTSDSQVWLNYSRWLEARSSQISVDFDVKQTPTKKSRELTVPVDSPASSNVTASSSETLRQKFTAKPNDIRQRQIVLSAPPCRDLPSPPSSSQVPTMKTLGLDSETQSELDYSKNQAACKKQSMSSRATSASRTSTGTYAPTIESSQAAQREEAARRISEVYLRRDALLASRWLSFDRVLFSPAHSIVKSSIHNRILVLDGMGNDEWAFYCAENYPQAVIYNLSPSASGPTDDMPSTPTKQHQALSLPANYRQTFHPCPARPFPFPQNFFSAAVLRFPRATSDKGYAKMIGEFQRVLQPGGHLEIILLDMDLCAMGNATRRALRLMKEKKQAMQPNISLRPLSDSIQRILARKGFMHLNRCNLDVPVAGQVSRSRQISLDLNHTQGIDGHGFRQASCPAQATPPGDIESQIAKNLARVGRWWYSNCYEIDENLQYDPHASLWRNSEVMAECKARETGFKLLLCHAQKPGRRRDGSSFSVSA